MGESNPEITSVTIWATIKTILSWMKVVMNRFSLNWRIVRTAIKVIISITNPWFKTATRIATIICLCTQIGRWKIRRRKNGITKHLNIKFIRLKVKVVIILFMIHLALNLNQIKMLSLKNARKPINKLWFKKSLNNAIQEAKIRKHQENKKKNQMFPLKSLNYAMMMNLISIWMNSIVVSTNMLLPYQKIKSANKLWSTILVMIKRNWGFLSPHAIIILRVLIHQSRVLNSEWRITFKLTLTVIRLKLSLKNKR